MLDTQLVGFTQVRRIFAATLVAFFAACILFAASSAQAQTIIIDSDGFESVGLPPLGTGYDVAFPFQPATGSRPALPVGSLEGQQVSLPGDATTAPWLASSGTNSTAIVQSAVVQSGTQAVEVTRAVGDAPSFWGAPVAGWPDNSRFICIEWDMLVLGPAGDPSMGQFGPYFGVDAIDDAGVGVNEGLLGSLGVLATSGDVVYTDEEIGLKQTGATVNFGEWNRFRIDLDFDLSVYTVFLNDVSLLTIPFVGGPGIGDGTMLNDFSDAPISTFDPFPGFFDPTSGLTAGDLAGTAYFDNYRVFQPDMKIPEPSTALLCLAGVAALVSRRRRS